MASTDLIRIDLPRLAVALVLLLAAVLPTTLAEASSGGVQPGGASPGKTIDGVSPSYAKFAELVSGRTDLSLRVLGAWTLAEGGPRDNPLNIGPGQRYGSISAGARATSNLLRESLYRGVLASASKPDRMQIKAIANSSWCPGCAGYQRLLRSTYGDVRVLP